MTINRFPLFVWGILVTSLLIIFAIPSITVALILLLFDRYFGTGFISPRRKATRSCGSTSFGSLGIPKSIS